MTTGIVVALPEELSTLTAKRIDKGRIELIAEDIYVIYSGVGHENAAASAESLVKRGVNGLVSWGCAAALDESCQPGDLVLANTCIDADHVEIKTIDKGWLKFVQDELTKQQGLQLRTGKLSESRAVVESSYDKAQIAKVTSAVALDMESAAVAKVAKLHGLPFLAIRAIADPLDMDLPKAVSHALGAEGEVILSKLLLYLLLHPSELPGLLKLGLHFNAARKSLKRVANQLNVLTINPLGTH